MLQSSCSGSLSHDRHGGLSAPLGPLLISFKPPLSLLPSTARMAIARLIDAKILSLSRGCKVCDYLGEVGGARSRLTRSSQCLAQRRSVDQKPRVIPRGSALDNLKPFDATQIVNGAAELFRYLLGFLFCEHWVWADVGFVDVSGAAGAWIPDRLPQKIVDPRRLFCRSLAKAFC